MNSQNAKTTRLTQWYRSAAHGLFYFLTFSLPLLALPWTLEAQEVNKQTLLMIIGALAMIAWLGAMVVERQSRIRTHAWWWIVLLFLASVLISASFSADPFTSWIGQNTQEYTSVLSLIVFVGLLGIGAHTLSETVTQRRMWSLLFIGSAIVTILALLGQFSWAVIEVVGTPYGTGTYLAIMTVLCASMWVVHDPSSARRILPEGWKGSFVQLCMLMTMIGSVIVLLALDFWVLWVMLIVGTGLLFVFALLRANEFPRIGRFVVPMALFVISLLFLFVPSVVPNTFSSELGLSYGSSWDIAKQSLQNESLLFGSGPGTFVMDYTEYRSTEINKTVVWDQRFDRGASHLLTMLATYGAVPTLLYVFFIVWLMGTTLARLMRRSQPHDEWKMTFVAFGGWVVTVVAQVFYPSNMTLTFVFWLLTAVLASQVFLKEKVYLFERSSRTALFVTFAFVVMNVALLTMMFVSGSRYGAEISFAKAVHANEQGAPIDEVIVQLESAATLNRWSDVYKRNLAQAYLLRTAQLVSDPQSQPGDIQLAVERALAAAQQAVALSPSNVLNWALLGDLYREVTPLVSGADVFAIQSYQQAIVLAPSNPKYFVALARAYTARADQLALLMTSEDETVANQVTQERRTSLEAAEAALQEALSLKNDYAAAYYYLALVHERSGKISEAIDHMVTLRDAYPYDTGVAFQLGLLYLRQGKVDEARTELERAVTLSPSYANAHWYLAAVYEELGDREAALASLKKILETNPGNETVTAQVDRIEAGLAAEEEVPEPLEDVVETEEVSQSE